MSRHRKHIPRRSAFLPHARGLEGYLERNFPETQPRFLYVLSSPISCESISRPKRLKSRNVRDIARALSSFNSPRCFSLLSPFPRLQILRASSPSRPAQTQSPQLLLVSTFNFPMYRPVARAGGKFIADNFLERGLSSGREASSRVPFAVAKLRANSFVLNRTSSINTLSFQYT